MNLLARREAKDIWQNLYEYPLIETGQETELEVLQQTPAYLELMQEAGEIQILRSFIMPKHVLSHRIIYARFYDAALFTGTGRGTGTICRFPFDRAVPGKMIKKKRLCPAGAGIRQKFVIIPTRQ